MEPPSTQHGVDALVAKFEDLSLPRERWDHAAHLAVGLVYVLRYGPAGAMQELQDRIPAYNRATGRTARERNGYRDDVTRFFVTAIHAEIQRRKGRDCTVLLAELCSGPLAVRQPVFSRGLDSHAAMLRFAHELPTGGRFGRGWTPSMRRAAPRR